MRLLHVLCLIVLSTFAYALSAPYCSGSISQSVPAVIGNGGGLVGVTEELVPSMAGNGTIYAGVYPTLGISTQESIDQAVTYAFAASNKELSCNALISFSSQEENTGFIDGPSAGAAFTVMTYALLNNRTMRNDTIITGTIEDLGDIGAVGGLYEKASSAARGGAKYFIAPVEGFYEMLILRNVERAYGITVLHARNVQDVIGFMLDNISIDQGKALPEKRATPNVSSYDSSAIASFLPVSSGMVSLENQTLATITATDNDSAAVREFYTSETVRQADIVQKGYLFTAANEAFLNFIDLSTIRSILANDSDISRRRGELGACLGSIRRPVLTDRNFEWVVGSDLRQAWAYDKMEGDMNVSGMLEDERYLAINDMYYGIAWCNVAGSILSAAPQGGTPIDETAWKTLAAQKIIEAKNLQLQKPDSISRLAIAQSSYNNGKYGAAIYDAVYVMNNEEAPPTDEEATKAQVMTFLNENRTSLWGRIYQSHAAFLFEENESASAWPIARFAKELDDATAQMVNATESNSAAQKPPAYVAPQSNVSERLLLSAGFAALSIFLLVVALIVLVRMTRRADGNERTGRDNRAKQKKG
jgi:hypothetical protein